MVMMMSGEVGRWVGVKAGGGTRGGYGEEMAAEDDDDG